MLKAIVLPIAVVISITSFALADTFGTGDNAFNIDFVPISGDAGNLGSWSAGSGYTFSGVNHGDYRMGKFEITNDQWTKFKAAYGTVTGSPLTAYDEIPTTAGSSVPTSCTSWYEAAQFVNYLNTSSGHQSAYKFIGTKGTSDYTLIVWDATDAWGGTNLYRHKDAFYFLPTEDEWVKAAYWNGTNLQQYATKAGETLTQGNGTSGTGWNYYTTQPATNPIDLWNVGSGSEELNGTHDMMGNVWEWMESPYISENYLSGSEHGIRGGAYYYNNGFGLSSSSRTTYHPDSESFGVGFRVASIPEPASLLLLALGGLLIRKR